MDKPTLKAGCLAWLEYLWVQTESNERSEFLNLEETDLIGFHMTLCMDMRNENKLWTYTEIIECPDDFSMSVLYDFWREKNGL